MAVPARSDDAAAATPDAFAASFRASADESVCVLLGVQGSGTNLLSRLLRRAFNLSVLHDQAFVVRVAASLDARPTTQELEAALRRVRAAMFPGPLRRRLAQASFHRDPRLAGIEDYFRAAAPATPAEFARFVYAYRAFRTGRAGMAIKSDDVWAHIDAFDRVLPHRRIVLLTRDFRDNAISIVHKPFGPRTPAIAAGYVRDRFAYYERAYREHAGGGTHVRFEDLVNAPAATIRRVGAAVGLGALAGDAWLEGFPIRTGRVGRWRQLPPRQLAWCETVLRRELLAYDYELATPASFEASAWDRGWERAADIVLRVPQKLRQLQKRVIAASSRRG
jgi:hypothetical protein